jgi:hypothetical protein
MAKFLSNSGFQEWDENGNDDVCREEMKFTHHKNIAIPCILNKRGP